jgi:hypothetical protein
VAWSDDGPGLWGRAGSGVSHAWGHQRPPGRAPLRRRARGWSPRRDPVSAAGGHPARTALQRVGPLAHAPPSGGPWQAWSARVGRRRARDQERAEEAGRVVRRVARAMAALGGVLRAPGVAPTHALAARG